MEMKCLLSDTHDSQSTPQVFLLPPTHISLPPPTHINPSPPTHTTAHPPPPHTPPSTHTTTSTPHHHDRSPTQHVSPSKHISPPCPARVSPAVPWLWSSRHTPGPRPYQFAISVNDGGHGGRILRLRCGPSSLRIFHCVMALTCCTNWFHTMPPHSTLTTPATSPAFPTPSLHTHHLTHQLSPHLVLTHSVHNTS